MNKADLWAREDEYVLRERWDPIKALAEEACEALCGSNVSPVYRPTAPHPHAFDDLQTASVLTPGTCSNMTVMFGNQLVKLLT